MAPSASQNPASQDPAASHPASTGGKPFSRLLWRLKQRVSATPFDEDFYLSAYPDVAEGLQNGGQFLTAFHHYATSGAAEGRRAMAPPEPPAPDLTRVPTIHRAYLELTTKCNLRCVYCPVSQPTYLNIHYERDWIERTLEQLRERRVEIVQLNGHGESTVFKGWEVLADRLADEGFELHLTTNLSKKLKSQEIAALSRFQHINFSVDTIDPQLTAALRRGSKLEMVLENVQLIRDYAKERNRNLTLAVSCVVSEQTALGLEDMVQALLELEVRVFRFADLQEYPAVPGAAVARNLSRLDPEGISLAGEGFRRALERIEDAGGEAEIEDPIRQALLEDNSARVESQTRDPQVGEKTVHYQSVPEGLTRDCLDPWTTAYLHANGTVRPCCFYEDHLGVATESSLSEIYNNEAFRALRKGLLSGDLPSSCATCAARAFTSREDLQQKVEQHAKREEQRAKID